MKYNIRMRNVTGKEVEMKLSATSHRNAKKLAEYVNPRGLVLSTEPVYAAEANTNSGNKDETENKED